MARLGEETSSETRAKLSKANKGNKSALDYRWTPEQRANLSKAKSGKKHYMFGKHHTEETKAKMSAALKGSHSNLGYHHTPEWKAKMSAAMLGRVFSEEWKAKIRVTSLRRRPTKETRLLMSQNHRDMRGGKNHSWQGGISFLPYPLGFNEELKARIRERDNYICQKCRIAENGRRHSIHHIDYDKDNLSDWNLITLCLDCNNEVNAHRDYWQAYFTQLLIKRSIVYV